MSIRAIAWAWKQEIPGMAKLVLLTLADHHNDETQQCNPRTKRIADKAGLSPRNVHKQLAALKDMGLISIEHNYREDGSLTASDYTLALSSDPKAVPTDSGAQGYDSGAYQEPVIEPINEPSSVTEDSFQESSVTTDIYISDAQNFENPDVWPEWYSLLFGMEGVKVSFAQAEAWRKEKGISEDLAERTVYALRDWWPRQPPGRRKSGDPYATWQNWCRRELKKPATLGNRTDHAEQYRRRFGSLPWETVDTETGEIRDA